MHRIIYFLVLVLHSNMLNGQITTEALQAASEKHSSEFFIENKGQWPDEVLFLARLSGLDSWITKQGITFDLFQMKESTVENSMLEENAQSKNDRTISGRLGQVIQLKLVNSNSDPTTQGKIQSDAYYNYFLGNDKSKWKSHVSLFEEIVIEDVYPDIDLRYYFDDIKSSEITTKSVRYDFVLQPNAQVSEIKLHFDGVENYEINEFRELIFQTRFGEMKQMDLFAYQIVGGVKKEVSSNFIKNSDGTIGFSLEDYDKSKPLIIDPIIYSTYLGGSSSDLVKDLAVDLSGNVIAVGLVQSSNFPTSAGAYDQSLNGAIDVFVSKLNANGNNLIFSSFIGGNASDRATSIAIDSEGNSYFTGVSSSFVTNSYPTTPGAYGEQFGADLDGIFITKLNATGSSLLYSTHIASAFLNDIQANDIEVDANQNVFITGAYGGSPSGFPTTLGAYVSSALTANNLSAYILKLNNLGNGLIYSTFITGTDDIGYGINIDINGNAYVTGVTNWPNVATNGAYDQSYNGQGDAFVCKMNNLGSAPIYTTYLGGNTYEYGISIKADSLGCAYILGDTYSADFPTTNTIYDDSYSGTRDMFLTKLNADGNDLIYSTFIGASNLESALDLEIDTSGNAYICGYTFSTDYPTSSDAFDQSFNGGSLDGVFTIMDALGNELIYSTYFGAISDDAANTIALNNDGNIYVGGSSFGSGLPTTSGAYDQTNNGSYDGFVSKWCIEPSVITANTFSNNPVCSGQSFELGANSPSGFSYTWTGPNSFTSNEQFPVIPSATAATDGVYYVTIQGNCSSKIDSVTVAMQATPIVIATSDVNSISTGGSVNFSNTGSNASEYMWNFGDGQNSNLENVIHSYPTAGTYNVILTGMLNGCYDSSELIIMVGHAGIDQIYAENDIVIHPNPTHGNFNVKLNLSKTEKIEISLYDMLGQLVFLDVLENYSGSSLSYNVPNESNGIYILKIKTENETFNKRLEIIK